MKKIDCNTLIKDCDLPGRLNNVICSTYPCSITPLGKLSSMSSVEILRIKNFGQKTLNELESFLESHGMQLRDGPRAERWQNEIVIRPSLHSQLIQLKTIIRDLDLIKSKIQKILIRNGDKWEKKIVGKI